MHPKDNFELSDSVTNRLRARLPMPGVADKLLYRNIKSRDSYHYNKPLQS